MTGVKEFNFPLFNKAAEELRQKFHQVINPAEQHPDVVPGTKTWEWYLREDLKAMLNCEVIALLPDWQLSRGAMLEVTVADKINMWVFEVDTDTFELKPTVYGNQDMTGLPS